MEIKPVMPVPYYNNSDFTERGHEHREEEGSEEIRDESEETVLFRRTKHGVGSKVDVNV